MPLFLKSVPSSLHIPSFLSHIVPCRAGVKTLFRLSFNLALTPLPFNFHSLHSFNMMKRSHYERENGFFASFFKHIRILERTFLILESYFLCHIPLTLSISPRKTMAALTTIWSLAKPFYNND